jgi:hypothetical protein
VPDARRYGAAEPSKAQLNRPLVRRHRSAATRIGASTGLSLGEAQSARVGPNASDHRRSAPLIRGTITEEARYRFSVVIAQLVATASRPPSGRRLAIASPA